ncbi:MAG: hypothetical protein ACRDTD_02290 [Pseudonocardiaceae bacterium]
MLEYLARPEVIDTLCAADQQGDCELAAVRDQLAVVRARHEQLADAVAAGTVSVTTLVRAEPTMLAEITKLEAPREGTEHPQRTARPDPTRHRRRPPMGCRTHEHPPRDHPRAAHPDLIGELRLQPSPRRGRHRTPARERTQWWRG